MRGDPSRGAIGPERAKAVTAAGQTADDSYPQKQANIAQYRVRIADLARKVRDRQMDAKEMPAARRNYLRVTVRNYRCGSRRREIASHQETCIDGLLLSGAVTPAGFGLGPFIVF